MLWEFAVIGSDVYCRIAAHEKVPGWHDAERWRNKLSAIRCAGGREAKLDQAWWELG
jgi:hypothetical protein